MTNDEQYTVKILFKENNTEKERFLKFFVDYFLEKVMSCEVDIYEGDS